MVDPKPRVLGNRDVTTTAAITGFGSVIGWVIQAQRVSLVDLGLVKSESEQRSRCVALRRRQIRRRCHITLKFESRKFEADVKYILAFCGSCN